MAQAELVVAPEPTTPASASKATVSTIRLPLSKTSPSTQHHRAACRAASPPGSEIPALWEALLSMARDARSEARDETADDALAILNRP